MQETAEPVSLVSLVSEPEGQAEKPKKLPCVYDEKIAQACPIRAMLNIKTPQDSFSKYVQPNNPAFKEIQAFMKGYMDVLKPLLEQELSHLSSFCHNCPARILYIKRACKQ